MVSYEGEERKRDIYIYIDFAGSLGIFEFYHHDHLYIHHYCPTFDVDIVCPVPDISHESGVNWFHFRKFPWNFQAKIHKRSARSFGKGKVGMWQPPFN